MTNPSFQETPRNEEPFITLSYNHKDFNALVELLGMTIINLETGIERLSLEGRVNVELITLSKEKLAVYQAMYKTALDEYDSNHRGAKHHRG